MLKIDAFTICLHCGCDRNIVDNQIQALKPLESEYDVFWNNRIDRFPFMYPTYSELINHSVATSPTEWVILINDRCHPTAEEVKKMLGLLESGFSCVLLYNVGFIGFAKELIRRIGWWDERFKQGWEDRDWVWRLKLANLAIYESQESTYDSHWRSPLNHPSGRCETDHLNAKYVFSNDSVIKKLKEENYKWDGSLGKGNEEIAKSWMDWNQSILGIQYDKPNSGPPGSFFVENKKIIEDYNV